MPGFKTNIVPEDDSAWGIEDNSATNTNSFGLGSLFRAPTYEAMDANGNIITKPISGSAGLGSLMDLGKIGSGIANAYLGYKNYGLAKDQFNYNKMARDRDYNANKLKYNNALARTNAVQSHYGLGSVAKNL